jgi:hypothetical protein
MLLFDELLKEQNLLAKISDGGANSQQPTANSF